MRSSVSGLSLSKEMIYRTLGSTGERVSAIGIGGWHLGSPKLDERLGIRLIHTAIDRGINFLDNSWDYNQGASEIRMGKALRNGYRKQVFLMTKIDGRSKKEAERQLDESLHRLTITLTPLLLVLPKANSTKSKCFLANLPWLKQAFKFVLGIT
jgi:predicted aldo/keto reductase-like oxidoreductase